MIGPPQLTATVEQFERCVGPIGYGHDLPPWVASPHYQEQLPGPLGYLLVAFAPLGGIALGRGQGLRNGKAHTLEAQGISTDSITQTHLRPLLFTKGSSVERTGSRYHAFG